MNQNHIQYDPHYNYYVLAYHTINTHNFRCRCRSQCILNILCFLLLLFDAIDGRSLLHCFLIRCICNRVCGVLCICRFCGLLSHIFCIRLCQKTSRLLVSCIGNRNKTIFSMIFTICVWMIWTSFSLSCPIYLS